MSKQSLLATASVLWFSAALLCWVLYLRADVHVDAHGILNEPFGLIPLGWLLLICAMVGGIAYFSRRFRANRFRKVKPG